jgi:hypothetical protein
VTNGIKFVYFFLDGSTLTLSLENLLSENLRTVLRFYAEKVGGIIGIEAPEEGLISIV